MPSLTASVTASSSSSSSTLTTGAITSDAADVLVVSVAIPSSSVIVTGVTDASGNTYSPLSRTQGGGVDGEVWYAEDAAASTTNTIAVTLSAPISGWAIAGGSYSGAGGVALSGVPLLLDGTGISVFVNALAAGALLIGHTFLSSAGKFSGLEAGFHDIPGSSTSFLVHQSYCVTGGDVNAGANNFHATLSASQNFIAILTSFSPNPWSAVAAGGKPYLTLSPVGIAAGYIANNGADYGPDTPGTSTSGVYEAATAAIAAGLPLIALGNFGSSSSPFQLNLSTFSNLEFHLPGTLTGQLIIGEGGTDGGGTRNHIYVRKIVGVTEESWTVQACIVELGSSYSRIEVLEIAASGPTINGYEANLNLTNAADSVQTEYHFGHIGGGGYSVYLHGSSSATFQWTGNWMFVNLIDSPEYEGIVLVDETNTGELIQFNSFMADLDGGSGSSTTWAINVTTAAYNIFYVPFVGNFGPPPQSGGQVIESLGVNKAMLNNLYIMGSALFKFSGAGQSISRVLQPPNANLGWVSTWFQTPSVPNSGVVQVNATPLRARVYLLTVGSATGVSLVDQTGISTPLAAPAAGQSWELDPGEGIEFVYASTPPTWIWYFTA